MIKNRIPLQEVPFRTRRMVEWTILALVVLLLVLVFAREMRIVQGQAELSAIKTTLGALRTAFVLDHLHKQVADGTTTVPAAQPNPFELLPRYPENYLGVMSREQAESAPAAGWVFDPDCVCVGYLPIWSDWLDSPSGDVMTWYRIGGAPGPLQLTAKEVYVWQGEILN